MVEDHEEEGINEIIRPYKEEPPASGWPMYVVALCLIALVPVGLAVWSAAHERYFESAVPIITITEKPDGLGAGSVRFAFALSDESAGLDEVVVRLTPRKSPAKEIFKKEYKGAKEGNEVLEINAAELALDPGPVKLTIRAFDRAVWSNTAEADIQLRVDFRKPRAEVVSVMHNAHVGGSQLCFYKAYDEDLSSSGVKVGERYYEGYPAKGLDREFDDPTLRVALYAIDMRERSDSLPVNVYSLDSVKNVYLGKFYNLAKPRRVRPVIMSVEKDKVDPLFDGDSAQGVTPSKAEASWILPFLVPKGSINLNFGDELIYKKNGVEVGRELVLGYLFRLFPNDRNVIATNDGEVSSVGKSKKIGSTVMIDHGLGLVSVYDRLDTVSVKKGAAITRGQLIGTGAQSPGAKVPDFYFEMRVHGVPVDPREWWDERWCNDHITKKVKDVKKALGVFPIPEGVAGQ